MANNMHSVAPVAALGVEERSSFIWKTYAHVVGAILAFAGISAYLISSGISAQLFPYVTANWLLTLGAFMLVSWGASHMAHRLESKPAQYAAFATGHAVEPSHLLAEVQRTRPLAVVMGEKLTALRQWAQDRTVRAN